MSFQTRELVEGDSDPVENSQTLPDIVPATGWVANIPKVLLCSLGLNSSKPHILVRSKYEEAERAALSAAGGPANAFAVTEI